MKVWAQSEFTSRNENFGRSFGQKFWSISDFSSSLFLKKKSNFVDFDICPKFPK